MATIAERLNPDDDDLLDEIEKAGGLASYARVIGVSGPGLRHAIQSRGLLDRAPRGVGGVKTPQSNPDAQNLTSDDPKEWGDLKTLLKSRGLSPTDWIITRARVNEWGEYRQLRVDLEPRASLLMPARPDGYRVPKTPARKVGKDGELVVFLGDHHAPHHDPLLHEATVAWLKEHQPHRGIILGDLLDLDAVSRHRPDPSWAATVQDTLDSGYAILRAYVEASPGTRWTMLDGNHEQRIRNAVIDNLRGLHGVRRAGLVDDHPVLSIGHLLRLDELGIEHVRPEGGYEHEQIIVSENLAARHGWIARKGSGSSAAATINHLRYSTVIGHTHRQSVVHHTAHNIDGEPRTLLGCEAGTLAKVDSRGLGYAIAPDWQQGFATATVWKDGCFKLDLATYTAGALMWRGWRYTP